MSASKTPLTDAKTYDVEVKRGDALLCREQYPCGSGDHVSASDCRAIEQRLNECVEALEAITKSERAYLNGEIPPHGRLERCNKAEKAIANARKPL
jgi:hypothetical protein